LNPTVLAPLGRGPEQLATYLRLVRPVAPPPQTRELRSSTQSPQRSRTPFGLTMGWLPV